MCTTRTSQKSNVSWCGPLPCTTPTFRTSKLSGETGFPIQCFQYRQQIRESWITRRRWSRGEKRRWASPGFVVLTTSRTLRSERERAVTCKARRMMCYLQSYTRKRQPIIGRITQQVTMQVPILQPLGPLPHKTTERGAYLYRM